MIQTDHGGRMVTALIGGRMVTALNVDGTLSEAGVAERTLEGREAMPGCRSEANPPATEQVGR
ncbi:MAG: hypothetical protein M0Z87_12260 [Actinomycetota bacterium]|nr:hypothetical protein [Actinomycetota bacterium]